MRMAWTDRVSVLDVGMCGMWNFELEKPNLEDKGDPWIGDIKENLDWTEASEAGGDGIERLGD